jgi:hypothetical protein
MRKRGRRKNLSLLKIVSESPCPPKFEEMESHICLGKVNVGRNGKSVKACCNREVKNYNSPKSDLIENKIWMFLTTIFLLPEHGTKKSVNDKPIHWE